VDQAARDGRQEPQLIAGCCVLPVGAACSIGSGGYTPAYGNKPHGGNIMKKSIGSLLLAGGIMLAGSAGASAQQAFTLSSSSFKDGTLVPQKITNSAANNPQNPNCVGENVSPQLSWSNPPAGTKSYALTVVDPEGRGGAGVVHWLAYGISVDVSGFDEGETSKPSPKFVGGKGTGGKDIWQGPCTPPGAPHHYTFVLIATDLDAKELPPGLTRDELLQKLAPPAPAASHVKGPTGLVGLWTKSAAK
jgi:Raf kinase inhibitor-like YbhB/YbcL family protein